MPEVGFSRGKIDDVLEAIRLHDNFHWDKEGGEKTDHVETKIIQDADRMDALGAIGVARITYYYGEKGWPIYSSDPVPETKTIWINHSLLNQIKRDPMKKWENMNFEISKKISKERNEFLTLFYKQLEKELLEHHGGDNV